MNTASKCYDAMLRLGAVAATGQFSGGHDEGGYDDVSFTAGGEDASIDEKLAGFDIYKDVSTNGYRYVGGRTVPISKPTRDADLTAIADHLDAVLNQEYGSFAGEFSVSGEVIVDAKARTTKIVGEEQVGYTPFEREL